VGLAHDRNLHASWITLAPRRSAHVPVSFGGVHAERVTMISYCIASYRPTYSTLLVQDLIRKTTTPFEILIWLNTDDERYEKFLEEQRAQGAPVRIVGKTRENIGMQAYPLLFAESQYDLIAQIDDDVVAVSRNIAEYAAEVFSKFPDVK